MIKYLFFYFLLISQIVLAQDLNAPVNEAIASWLGTSDNYEGYREHEENDQFSNHAAMFAQRAFIKKDISVGDWQAVRKLNYSYFPSEKIIEIVQVRQNPDQFENIFTGMFLFLENSKAERLVVGIKGSSLAIYYLNGNISIKDDFLPHYINYVKNHSPYAGGVLEFNDRQLITFFGKSQNYNSTWDKFIFDEAKKNVLKETIDGFLQNYNYTQWKQYGLPMSRGLLLYGPPGTGKSYIASVIATNILNQYYPNQTTYIHVQARHIKEPEDVRNIFNGARIYTPCVLFFEDIDLIAGTDRKTKPEVKNELMQQLSGLESLKGVLVIGTTNTFETIDPALKRSQRLGYHFEIGLPIFEERQKLLEVFLRSYTNKVTVEGFASKTEGMTGADIKALIDNAYLRTKELGLEVITNEILEEALSDFKTNFIKP